MKLNRALLATLFATTLFASNTALAQPVYKLKENAVKQVKTQVPGYFRYMVGDFEVTALYDGYLSIGTPIYQAFSPLSKQELDDLISGQFRPMMADGGVQTAVSAYLINTGKNLILLDAGSGNVFDDKVGKLVESLRAAGYKPEQVDTIIPTHLHFDHFSGVTVDGKAVFPNATLYIANQEKAFWFDTPIAKMPEHVQKYAQWTRDAVKPYADAGKVFYYNLGDEVVANVKSVPATGHTPGHGGFEVTSGDAKIFVWGDLLHNHAIQLPEPNVAAEFDVNAEGARSSRSSLLSMVAERKLLVAGAHLPFPGIGHIVKAERGFSWIPVEYVPTDY